MNILITEANREEIEALLREANGRARRYVWRSYDQIADAVEELEETLEHYGLPKTYRPGTRVALYSVDPKAFANAYNNDVIVTEGHLVRRRRGWVLTNLESISMRVGSGARNQVSQFQVTQQQAERCDAAWRRALGISLAKATP